MAIALHAAGKTDVGLVRPNNEDNFGFDARAGIFVVCDGMGGEVAGERASKIAVETMLDYFSASPKKRVAGTSFEGVSERANWLGQAIQLANQAIRRESAERREQAGMGSTVVALLARENYFSIAHVGDSRIYLIREQAIERLTEDHSLVFEQVRRGLITAEQAARSNLQNVIVRALGGDESVEPDLADLELLAGDLILLCSDGLTRRLADAEILSILMSRAHLPAACNELVQAAKDSGSDDNITCLLVQAREPSWSDRLFGWATRKRHALST
jgi:serine/threonine protein phosphatase PrpC